MQNAAQEYDDLDFLLSSPENQTTNQSNQNPADNPEPATNNLDNLPVYQDLCDSPTLFAETLYLFFPQISKEKEAAEKVKYEFTTTLKIAEDHVINIKDQFERSEALSDIKEYKKTIESIDNLLFEIDRRADAAILSLYSKKTARPVATIEIIEPPKFSVLSRSENTSPNQNRENNQVQTANSLQETIKFATPQYQELALCLAGINATQQQSRNPIWLARHTNLTIANVKEAMNDQNYRAYVAAVAGHCAKEIVRHGLNQKIRRLQQANANLEMLEQIRFERGALSTTADEVSDDELLAIGLDPRKRDLDAAMIPGASSGLLKKTPVVIRTISTNDNNRRGSRTQIVQTYEIDSVLLKETRAHMEFISKELGEFGNVPTEITSQEIKTYKGFDPSSV